MSRSYEAWVAGSMQRVFPKSLPPRSRALSVALELAAGEYRSFQVVLRPRSGDGLRNVRVETGPLAGETAIAAEHVEWRQVGYVRVEQMEYVKPSGRRPIEENVQLALAEGAEIPGWWPDPLLPVERFDVAAEFAQPVWVTVYAPPGTPPGACAGVITIIPENAPPVEIEISATVYPFALPQGAGTFPTAFALMEGQLGLVYDSVDHAMLRQWGDFALRHRLNPDNIYRKTPPDVENLEHFLRGGMNAFNVVDIKRGSIDEIPPFLEQLKQSPDADALFDLAYCYSFDELAVGRVLEMREDFRRIREEFGLPTFTTAHLPQNPADFRRTNTDWLCPLTSWLDAEKVARCRKAGFKIWTYISMEPDPPYANWRMDCPLIEARVLFWQAYQQQVDGFLYWGLNAWSPWHPLEGQKPIDPERDGPFLTFTVATHGEKLSWLHGDGILLYPGTRGPMSCIRLANIRDGLQDYEYLARLAKETGCPSQALDATAPITTGWTTFTHAPRAIETQRRRVARRISRLVKRGKDDAFH